MYAYASPLNELFVFLFTCVTCWVSVSTFFFWRVHARVCSRPNIIHQCIIYIYIVCVCVCVCVCADPNLLMSHVCLRVLPTLVVCLFYFLIYARARVCVSCSPPFLHVFACVCTYVVCAPAPSYIFACLCGLLRVCVRACPLP